MTDGFAPPDATRASSLDPTARGSWHGSYTEGDPDRPDWPKEVSADDVTEFPYNGADGFYRFSVFKARLGGGEKAFRMGRRPRSSDDVRIALQAMPKEAYELPGVGYVLTLDDTAPDIPYRYDELLAAMAEWPNERVFITEGEKDADTLWARGLIATTNPKGARHWSDALNAPFVGRDIGIMQDNDDAGEARSGVLVQQLASVAKSIKIIQLSGLGPKQDVTDWFEKGRTVEQFLAEIDKAEIIRDAAEWANARGEFARDTKGVAYKSPANARIALDKLGVTVRYDEFAARYLIDGLEGFGPALDDAGLTRLQLTVEERWHLAFGKERWHSLVTDYARRHSFHPVREYLDRLEWDGVHRLDRWLIEYAGAEDSEYVRAVGAICLIAAVRRVRKPGCKFDEMLVLESPQGTNKSSALAILAVEEAWFTDDCPLNAESKQVIEQLSGRWIVEMSELKGMHGGTAEHVKSMLSRQVDKARLAYGRMTTEQPRQCVFFGTTNDGQYLIDGTGNRRFWPVRVDRFELDALAAHRDQLWAEAAHREAAGESIRLDPKLWAAASAAQADREVPDAFYEILSDRLDGLDGKVRSQDVWEAVGLGEASRRTQGHNRRLPQVMEKLGWRRPKSKKLRFGGRSEYAWVKGEGESFEEVPRNVVLGFDSAGDDGRPM